ncbi:hypothetical protein OAH12_01820 [Cyclobacteriaceae bacterium]|nr:hypothetical protein [Cyclobacteriaceae bacterium]
MTKQFLTIFTLLVFNFSFAQEHQERVEVVSSKEYYSFDVQTIADKKLLVSYIDRLPGDLFTYTFEIRDEKLGVVKKETLKIPVNFRYKASDLHFNFDNKHASGVLLIHKRGGNDFVVYNINCDGLKITKRQGVFEKKINIYQTETLGEHVYLQAKYKGKLEVASINIQSGGVKHFPFAVKGKYYIEDLQLVGKGDKQELWAEFYQYAYKNHKLYTFKRFDINGKALKSFTLAASTEKYRLNISNSKTKNGSYFSCGTYNLKKPKGTSQGIYVTRYSNDGKVKYDNFINYMDLDNYTNYLPEKTENKLEKKHDKKKARGKELKIKQLMLAHEIIEKGDEYIFLGEGYYATYRTEHYTDWVTDANGNSRAVTRTRQVFDGYQYTHGLVVAFDEAGKKTWDQTFGMTLGYKPMHARKFFNATTEGKQLKIMYGTSSLLSSISIYRGDIVNQNVFSATYTENENDKVKHSYGDVGFWYGKNFVSYGYQKIKNKKDKNVAKKRFIYFINKIEFL